MPRSQVGTRYNEPPRGPGQRGVCSDHKHQAGNSQPMARLCPSPSPAPSACFLFCVSLSSHTLGSALRSDSERPPGCGRMPHPLLPCSTPNPTVVLTARTGWAIRPESPNTSEGGGMPRTLQEPLLRSAANSGAGGFISFEIAALNSCSCWDRLKAGGEGDTKDEMVG